jgi:RimJ/RimL family protein N-acetyltransferase
MSYLLINEETERLTFRKLEKSDFKDWLPLFENKEAGLFLGMDSGLTVRQQCEKWFEKGFYRYENDKGGMNVLVDKKTNKMIGQCGLLVQEIEGKEFIEIGYAILPEYWGKGFASEAAQKCKEFAFENNLRDELISVIHIDNVGSMKVAKRNGMTFFKRMDEYLGMPVHVFKVSKNK